MTDQDNDFLHGAAQIGAFLGVSTRRAYYLLESGQLPAAQLGARWVARRSTLTEHIDRLTAGEAA